MTYQPVNAERTSSLIVDAKHLASLTATTPTGRPTRHTVVPTSAPFIETHRSTMNREGLCNVSVSETRSSDFSGRFKLKSGTSRLHHHSIPPKPNPESPVQSRTVSGSGYAGRTSGADLVQQKIWTSLPAPGAPATTRPVSTLTTSTATAIHIKGSTPALRTTSPDPQPWPNSQISLRQSQTDIVSKIDPSHCHCPGSRLSEAASSTVQGVHGSCNGQYGVSTE